MKIALGHRGVPAIKKDIQTDQCRTGRFGRLSRASQGKEDRIIQVAYASTENQPLSFKVCTSTPSSLLEVNLNPVFVEALSQIGAKMSPEMISITIVSVALIWGGTSVYKLWLQIRKDINAAKLIEESRQFASDQETRRMEIFAKAISKEPQIGILKSHADDMYMSVTKGVSDAEMVSIAGHDKIPGETIRKMVGSQRAESLERRLVSCQH